MEDSFGKDYLATHVPPNMLNTQVPFNPPPDPRRFEAMIAAQQMGQQPQQSQFQQINVPDVQFSAAMKKQALIQGLGTAGLALLASMKNTPYPQSPMSNIGQAGLAGMQAYQGSMDNNMKQALEYARMQAVQSGGGYHYITQPDGTVVAIPTKNPGAGAINTGVTSQQPMGQGTVMEGGKPVLKVFPKTPGVKGEARPQFGLNLSQLLTPVEAEHLGVTYGTTKGQASNKGIQPMSPAQRENIAQPQAALKVIDQIESVSIKLNTATSALSRLGKGAENVMGAWAQTNPDAVILKNQGAKLSTLIRGLGEKGALSNSDVKRGEDNIPTVWDTKEVAKAKLQTIRDILNSIASTKEELYKKQFNVNDKPNPKSIKDMSTEELLRAL